MAPWSGIPTWRWKIWFEISAKLPDGASKDQAPEMLQALLKERFKLTFHTEKKDHPIYALIVAKGGPKLKVAEDVPAAPGATASGEPGRAPAPPRPPGDGPGAGPGGRGGPPPGGMSMRMGPGGGHIEGRAMTVARFAEAISRFLDRPVVDETAIAGNYDFGVDVSPDEMGNSMSQMRMAAGPMMMGAGRGAPDHAGPDGPPNAPEGGSIFQSIQQYGLKLEPKKAAMDMITIDSAEKTPTEN
jgi:uncharacterized protein (TIGR03435 family)